MTTVVVVPCYDEARRLPAESFRSFVEAEPDIDFVFVDDGSRDDTARVVEALCSSLHGRGRLLRLPRNMGKAEAVRTGMNAAFESDASVVGFWDADLATPLGAIPEMRSILDACPSCLMVFGARVRLLGRDIVRDTRRHYLGRLFATVVSLQLGLPVYDTQCGAKLFRATPEVRGLFAQPFRSRWIFDVEILARLRGVVGAEGWVRAGELINEHPLMIWRDVGGSKVKGRDFVRAALELLSIRRHELGRQWK